MATTLIGAHAFEHLYAHSIPLLAPIISGGPGSANAYAGTADSGNPFRSLVASAARWEDSLWTCTTTGWPGSCRRAPSALGLGYLLMSIAPTYFLILAALSLGSVGSAMWHPPALGLLARRFPGTAGGFHFFAPVHGEHWRLDQSISTGSPPWRRTGMGRSVLVGSALGPDSLARDRRLQHHHYVYLQRGYLIAPPARRRGKAGRH